MAGPSLDDLATRTGLWTHFQDRYLGPADRAALRAASVVLHGRVVPQLHLTADLLATLARAHRVPEPEGRGRVPPVDVVETATTVHFTTAAMYANWATLAARGTVFPAVTKVTAQWPTAPDVPDPEALAAQLPAFWETVPRMCPRLQHLRVVEAEPPFEWVPHLGYHDWVPPRHGVLPALVAAAGPPESRVLATVQSLTVHHMSATAPATPALLRLVSEGVACPALTYVKLQFNLLEGDPDAEALATIGPRPAQVAPLRHLRLGGLGAADALKMRLLQAWGEHLEDLRLDRLTDMTGALAEVAALGRLQRLHTLVVGGAAGGPPLEVTAVVPLPALRNVYAPLRDVGALLRAVLESPRGWGSGLRLLDAHQGGTGAPWPAADVEVLTRALHGGHLRAVRGLVLPATATPDLAVALYGAVRAARQAGQLPRLQDLECRGAVAGAPLQALLGGAAAAWVGLRRLYVDVEVGPTTPTVVATLVAALAPLPDLEVLQVQPRRPVGRRPLSFLGGAPDPDVSQLVWTALGQAALATHAASRSWAPRLRLVLVPERPAVFNVDLIQRPFPKTWPHLAAPRPGDVPVSTTSDWYLYKFV